MSDYVRGMNDDHLGDPSLPNDAEPEPSVDAYQALRESLARAIYDVSTDYWHDANGAKRVWEDIPQADQEEHLTDADAVLAELLNHKIAVLNHIGSVREGDLYTSHSGGIWEAFPHEPDPDPLDNPPDLRCYVVTFGAAAKEATDA